MRNIVGKKLPNGAIEWRDPEDGKLHKENSPAYQSERVDIYYYNGRVHRTDGPALVNKIANKTEWWIHGREYSFEEWLKKVDIGDESIVKLKLKYGKTGKN